MKRNNSDRTFGTLLNSACLRENRGFTLLEVLIAISIIAITLTTLFGSQSYSLMIAAETKFNTMASLLSREIISGLESGVVDYGDAEGDFGEEFPGYTWNIEVQEAQLDGVKFESPGEVRLYRVDLTIAWAEDEYVFRTIYYGLPTAGE